MAESEEKSIGRIIGVGLIIAGAVMVIFGAIIAYISFYGYTLSTRQISTASLEVVVASLVYMLVEVAVKLGFLGIIIWAGGILLKYGIQSIREEKVGK